MSARARVTISAMLLLVAACTSSAVPTAKPSTDLGQNPFRAGRTLVIPHGGGDGLYPEDTLIAYRKTIAMGADVVDVDLRVSADGVVTVIHDATVDRATGTPGAVAKMTYAELSRLDAGWGFAAADGSHPFRGTGVTIPSFEQVLTEFPHTLLSVDLKDQSTAMVQPVCDLLIKHNRLSDVFVGSDGDDQIFAFRKACPTVRTSATLADVFLSRDARAADDPTFVPAALVDQPPLRLDGKTLVDESSLAWSHAHDVAILPWVVNDEKDMKSMIALGIDGMYTSYPDRLLKLLGRYHDPG